MALLNISGVRISGIAASVPKNSFSNYSLENFSDEELSLLIKTTGIHSRRISPKDLKASDLCFSAAEELIDRLKWNKEDIDVLIYVSQTPDYQVPGTSMQLQYKLGLQNTCLALDINLGCSGYVYGLSTIASMMSASTIKKGLLLVGDTITKLLAPNDKSTVPIFSDAGSATALEYDNLALNMVFNLQSNGKGYDNIIKERNDFLKMKGAEVFNFGLKEVVPNFKTLESHFNIDLKTINFYVFHQANLLLNEAIRRKLGLEKEKVLYSLKEYGNTSCATIPLTIVSCLQSRMESEDLKLGLSGFGVGMSWGSAVIQFSNVVCPPLIEV
jgi:3-oxoacyl-[acyl-carrier-protein] synthase-3